jgi:cytochrome c oxidase subunit 1
MFGVFAGLYYWWPKMFGRFLDERLGKLHWALSFIGFNGVFFPMHILGANGMPRRVANPFEYDYLQPLQGMSQMMTMFAFLLGVAQLVLFYNIYRSLRVGERAAENPWHANTLEWAAPSPPPHGNFGPVIPTVYRGPYEFSSPDSRDDYLPQWSEEGVSEPERPGRVAAPVPA